MTRKNMTPEEFNARQYAQGVLTDEHITEMVRHWQETHELEVDGMAGNVTRSTIDALLAPQAVPDEWGTYKGSIENQPTNTRQLVELFGRPGGVRLDASWKKRSIVELHQRHGNRLPGAPSNRYVHVHRLVEEYLREGMRRAQVAAPNYVIERIGSFNFRHIRHDLRRPLSRHSWGIAVDFDPHKNFSRTFKKGQAPKEWSEEYTAIWPDGLPREFVEAMQSCGWAWGSDWDEDGSTDDHTFLDPMHFEWVNRE